MPRVDGLEATRQIRKYETEHGLNRSYIISYTADVTDKASTLLRSNGTNEIMSKPPPKGFLAGIVGRFVIETEEVSSTSTTTTAAAMPVSANESLDKTVAAAGTLIKDAITGDETANRKRRYEEILDKTQRILDETSSSS